MALALMYRAGYHGFWNPIPLWLANERSNLQGRCEEDSWMTLVITQGLTQTGWSPFTTFTFKADFTKPPQGLPCCPGAFAKWNHKLRVSCTFRLSYLSRRLECLVIVSLITLWHIPLQISLTALPTFLRLLYQAHVTCVFQTHCHLA